MAHKQLTKNFKLSEFKCRDGTDVPEEYMDYVQQLAENLQVLRHHIGKPIHVISGYRSPKYNTKIKGARRSQHMLAKAADIIVHGMKPKEVHQVILQLIKEGHLNKGGVGLYKYFVHYAIRGFNARWKGKGIMEYKP